MDEWRLPISSLGIGSGSTSSVAVIKGDDGVSSKWLISLRRLNANLWVLAVGGWWACMGHLFFFFMVYGLMVLWSEAGTDVSHQLGRHRWLLCWLGDEKLMWGLGVYTNCRGWFRLVQDLMGQKLERYRHIWLACFFDGFAFKWLSTVVLYGLEVCSDTKTDVGNHTISMEQINNEIEQRINPRSQHQAKLKSTPV